MGAKIISANHYFNCRNILLCYLREAECTKTLCPGCDIVILEVIPSSQYALPIA